MTYSNDPRSSPTGIDSQTLLAGWVALTGSSYSSGVCTARRFASSISELPIYAAEAQILDLEKLLHSVFRALAADAGFLEPAEWRDFVGNNADVDADDAVFERFGDAPDT